MTEHRERVEEAFLASLLEELHGHGTPSDLSGRILADLQQPPQPDPRPRSWRWWTAALLLLGLGLVVTTWALQQAPAPTPQPVQAPQDGRTRVQVDSLAALKRLLGAVESIELDMVTVDGLPAWVPGEQAMPPESITAGARHRGILQLLGELRPAGGPPSDGHRDERVRLLLEGGRRIDVWVDTTSRATGTPGTVRIDGLRPSFIPPPGLLETLGTSFARFDRHYRLGHGIIGSYQALDRRRNPDAQPGPVVMADQWRIHKLEPDAFRALLADRGDRPLARLDLRSAPALMQPDILRRVLRIPGLETLLVAPAWLYVALPEDVVSSGLKELLVLPEGECYWKQVTVGDWELGDPTLSICWSLDHPAFRGLRRLAVAAPVADCLSARFYEHLPKLRELRGLTLHGPATEPQHALPRAAQLPLLEEVHLLGVLPESCFGVRPKDATGPAGVGLLRHVRHLDLSLPAPAPSDGGDHAGSPTEMRPYHLGQVLEQLKNCPRLEHLELDGWAKDQPATAWWPKLQALHLTVLSLGDCPRLGAEELLGLRAMKSLRTLVLTGHGLGGQDEARVTRELRAAIDDLSVIRR